MYKQKHPETKCAAFQKLNRNNEYNMPRKIIDSDGPATPKIPGPARGTKAKRTKEEVAAARKARSSKGGLARAAAIKAKKAAVVPAAVPPGAAVKPKRGPKPELVKKVDLDPSTMPSDVIHHVAEKPDMRDYYGEKPKRKRAPMSEELKAKLKAGREAKKAAQAAAFEAGETIKLPRAAKASSEKSMVNAILRTVTNKTEVGKAAKEAAKAAKAAAREVKRAEAAAKREAKKGERLAAREARMAAKAEAREANRLKRVAKSMAKKDEVDRRKMEVKEMTNILKAKKAEKATVKELGIAMKAVERARDALAAARKKKVADY